ncbi:MAG: nucleotide sugar dehydrogenase [Candidatus Nanopelagicales bacterium]
MCDRVIAVIGLGYVGLPLAVAFAEGHDVIAFDINASRIDELQRGEDCTREVEAAVLGSMTIQFTSDPADLDRAEVFLVAVPTPVDTHKRPDLSHLEQASRTIGDHLRTGDLVVYESTVYPGATQEVCIPALESASGLRCGVDFGVGYSPERVNPGDTGRRLTDVVKVVSGCSPQVAQDVAGLYGEVVTAGVHPVSSIRVAEAAKVIENTQRDVNIALVNELAVLFNRLGLDTQEVLEAAGTKWNFLPFRPGLVGGHCIGVDPYYLTHKAVEVGHHPEVILAGRRINDGMGQYVADEVVLLMTRRGIAVGGSRVLVLGLTFKENCPDVKNTRVVDMVRRLEEYGAAVDVVDPWVTPEQAKGLGVNLVDVWEDGDYTAAILAVGHGQFTGIGQELRRTLGPDAVLYDVKGLLGEFADARL